MEFLRPPEFIRNTAVPFALRACERFESQPVTGKYDQINQIWNGDNLSARPTLTLTSQPEGFDNDADW